MNTGDEKAGARVDVQPHHQENSFFSLFFASHVVMLLLVSGSLCVI